MRIKIEPYGQKQGFHQVTPTGPLDSNTYIEFQDKTAALLTKETIGIVLDFAGVDYIASAGLGVLFTLKKWLKAKGGDLYFMNVQPQVLKVFEIVKALPPETVFESYDEADKYFYRVMNEEKDKGPKKA